MRKINITIKNDITDEQALELVLEVIIQGRISNEGKSYCYCTRIGNNLILAINKTFNGNYSDDIWFDGDFAHILHLDLKDISFDLTKETLEEQSEETQRGINKLLHYNNFLNTYSFGA
jgi:hypothetical protein